MYLARLIGPAVTFRKDISARRQTFFFNRASNLHVCQMHMQDANGAFLRMQQAEREPSLCQASQRSSNSKYRLDTSRVGEISGKISLTRFAWIFHRPSAVVTLRLFTRGVSDVPSTL